ncbi:MAG: DUF1667 domain-containing protein [Lachnospiraceae bacterium]|nr:DUF1667 domain-containing protein [Lachnospiraceae bacterium]
MVRELTCIMCPMGCDLTAEKDERGNITVTGNTCPRGREYAMQELTAPMRNIATSVLVEGGELPLASVRLDGPIPRERIFDVMQEIKGRKVKAPVQIGDVLIENVLGLGRNVVITKNVAKRGR